MREKLSYSYLHLLACPWAAFLRYEAAIKTPPTPWLALGTAVHKAIEIEHSQDEWDLNRAAITFSSAFQTRIEEEEISVNYAQMRKLDSEGIEMLGRYYAQLQDGKVQAHPLAVEKEFEIQISGITVVGVIDRAEETDDGLVISDNKTGKTKPTEWDLRHNLQGTAYWIASKEIFGRYPVKFVWHHLRTGDMFASIRDENDIKNLEAMVANAKALSDLGVRHRIYHERVCDWCDYRGDICDDMEIEKEYEVKRHPTV